MLFSLNWQTVSYLFINRYKPSHAFEKKVVSVHKRGWKRLVLREFFIVELRYFNTYTCLCIIMSNICVV